MRIPRTALLLLLGGVLPCASFAQGFSSGSTGADGALDVTTDTTLDLPPNGTFNYTTVNVAAGVTLRFNRNALNTPVYLLATGDITMHVDRASAPYRHGTRVERARHVPLRPLVKFFP